MKTADHALSTLRAALDQGTWGPGARLPAERALAAELGLGRGTLRKALDALAREGRIRRRVGEGTFVSDAPAATLRFAAAPTPADVLEARRMVEPAIAAAAALRARAPEIEALQALAAPTETDDWREWEARDAAFHAAVAAASRNPLLSALLDTLHEIRRREDWGRLRRETVTPSHRRAHARQHAAIAAAIADRDAAGAQAAMRTHLIAVEAAMTGAPADLDAAGDRRPDDHPNAAAPGRAAETGDADVR
ncbi:MAG: FadR/GntR family transcriptional regulator [Rubrimonas sp.]